MKKPTGGVVVTFHEAVAISSQKSDDGLLTPGQGFDTPFKMAFLS